MTLEKKFSVKHIIREGARFHVHSYSLCRSRAGFREDFALTWCSEPFCEDNLHSVKKCIKEGHSPEELCPCTAAKEWFRSEEGLRAVAKTKALTS